MNEPSEDTLLGDLPRLRFGAAFAAIHEFANVGLSLGEEIPCGFLGVGWGRCTFVAFRRTEIHAYLAFVNTRRFTSGDDDARAVAVLA